MQIFWISITGCIALLLIEEKHSVAANSSINPIEYEEKTLSHCNPQNCHYGKCVHGNCVCYEGWTGTGCQHCTGKVRLSKLSGSISTGIGNYTNNAKCSWLIEGPKPNSIIRLYIEEFATEYDRDNLYIYDGDSVEAPLLATFSGLISTNLEITARSGNVFLSFYTNDRVAMSGFNITYKIDSCPTRNSSRDCSGHGKCVDGSCHCDLVWKGEACDEEICPNNCFRNISHGWCALFDLRSCACPGAYPGDDCGKSLEDGFWRVIDSQRTSDNEPKAPTGHCAVYWDNMVYIIGGISFQKQNFVLIYDVDQKQLTSPLSNPEVQPKPRYGHSCILSGNKIYMYGGKIINSTQTNEVWIYHINRTTSNWDKITLREESRNTVLRPLEVSGHTAHMIKSANGEEKMLAIFGYSDQLGYLNVVQEYDLNADEWRVVDTIGYPVRATYGHSSVYDSESNLVFVYGGYASESSLNQAATNRLYSYHTIDRKWRLLTPAPSARYLHSAIFTAEGTMMVFGGKTAEENCGDCRELKALKYEVASDTWSEYDVSDEKVVELPRYGHTATHSNQGLLIYGGFNGQMIGDAVLHFPATCWNKNQEACLGEKIGRKCKWNVKQNVCLEMSYDPFSDDDCITRQPNKPSLNNYCEYQFGEDCLLCYGNCSKNDCKFISSDDPGSKNISSMKICETKSDAKCYHLHSCGVCMYNKNCFWSTDSPTGKCLPLPQVNNAVNTTESRKSIDEVCQDSCAQHISCGNCTTASCTWCQTEQRCVRTSGYLANYPYGECHDSTVQQSKCLDTETPTTDSCNAYKNCSNCNSDPACGWCDDDSGTGEGKCSRGGARQPSLGVCPSGNWYFGNCPSKKISCSANTTECAKPYDDSTPKAHSEECLPGYFGDPSNGKACEPCSCNNELVSDCDNRSGKCLCKTMGVIGDHCENCDTDRAYYNNKDLPSGTCYNQLTPDFQFTFNISKKEDLHRSKMNFNIIIPKSEKDTDFYIKCSKDAKMDIVIICYSAINVFAADLDCNSSGYEHRLVRTDYTSAEQCGDKPLKVFVYVYELQPPMHLTISFSQYRKVNTTL